MKIMSEAEDVCGCLACAALCSVCCVVAAEEDKRERERSAMDSYYLKTPMVEVNPVTISSPKAFPSTETLWTSCRTNRNAQGSGTPYY
jgi:hypothetical protein